MDIQVLTRRERGLHSLRVRCHLMGGGWRVCWELQVGQQSKAFGTKHVAFPASPASRRPHRVFSAVCFDTFFVMAPSMGRDKEDEDQIFVPDEEAR